MRVRIEATNPRFPLYLRIPRGPSHLEAIGTLAEGLESVKNTVAIVGTRRPPPEAWRYAHWLAATLTRAGALVVSGGAYGIDAAAHEGALSVEDGKTIAVLPTSVDKFSPAGNAALFRRIVKRGALVGFLDSHEQPRFHQRNAAIVAMCQHVIVVAAPIKSGARNTADEARRLNRTLWVVPGAPWDEPMQGCALELKTTGQPLISPSPLIRAMNLDDSKVGNDLDVLWRRPWTAAPYNPNPAPGSVGNRARPVRGEVGRERRVTSYPPPASGLVAPTPRHTAESLLPPPSERLLLESLNEGPATVDELVLRTALPVASVRALLLTWTVEGVLREGPPGLFRLING